MKVILLALAFAFTAFIQQAYPQTTLQVDANGSLNSPKIVAQTSAGQTFFTGHQLGSTYSLPYGIFRAWTDNTNGGNYFYDGVSGATTTYSIRSDGTGFFAGSVGIGTSAPLMRLHIQLPISKTSNAVSVNNMASFLSTNDATAPFGLRTMVVGGSTTANRYVTLQTTEYNTVDGGVLSLQPAAGNVGIGTQTPDQKLTVNGTIHSSAVKVDTSIPVPDYVFDTDYTLPSLSEIKNYVDNNHHLPEIPSAAQMIKEGIDLGQMNILLLKKVEELTLYLIEKDKQMQEQQTQIDQIKIDQQRKLNALQSKITKLFKSKR